MARNGSGTMSKAVSDFVFDTTISHTDMNTLIDDIIGEISNSVDKDGQTVWTGLMQRSVTVNQTANTGSAQGGNPIVSEFYEIAVCGNSGDAVTLPAAVAGQQVIVVNNGANSADVFPASGDKIDGGSANAAVAIAAGANRLFICQDATDWDVIGTTELSNDSSPQLGGFLDANGNYIQMQKGGDISSASPLVIDTDGDYFSVSGTSSFSVMTVAADRHFFLEFAGILTITHGSGTIDIPGAANYTSVAGDVIECVSTAANVVTIVGMELVSGKAQVESVTLANSVTLTNKTLTAPAVTLLTGTLSNPTCAGTASAAGTVLFKEDTDNGTNACTLSGPQATADVTVTLPAATDTLVGKATTDTLTNKTIVAANNTLTVTQGKQTIWIPAAAMRPTSSNGCAAITDVETTSGRPDMQVLDFDKDSDEHAQFQVCFPKSYGLGTITFQVWWAGLAATTGVAWALQGVGVPDNSTIDVAYGTAIVVTDDAQGAIEEVLVTAESGAVTIAGTVADNDICFFRIFRDVSDGNDDLAGDARLLGMKIFFTTDAENDA